MLSVKQLTRCYGSFTAVDQVSFTIDKGEIVGLLGHNGAGKTTIMKMLSGFLEPNQGSVTIDGLDLATDAKTIQASLGYLPENLPVYPEMTVADYLDYAADLKGLTGDEKRAEVRRVVKATELSAKLLAPIETLSRGFKQRVGVAQAILGNPKLLILDEPTNGLDPSQTEQMRRLIKSIAKNATVILSTHIMQEVDALCDRVLIVNSGRLVVDSPLDALRQSDTVHLVTSMPGENALLFLNPLNGVEDMNRLEGNDHYPDDYEYEIKLDQTDGRRQILASIAKAVVDAGHSIYRLSEVHRDLESVFREVSDPFYQNVDIAAEHQQQEVDHAA